MTCKCSTTGAPRNEISYFQQQSDLPLRVGVLVDLSDSITTRFAYEKQAAIAFLKKVLRPEVDQAFVVGFGSRIKPVPGLHRRHWRAVERGPRDERRRQYAACTMPFSFASAKLGSAAGPATMRRAIILISDGEDTRSKTIMYDAIQSALHAETVIFALSTNDFAGGVYPQGEAVLELISRADRRRRSAGAQQGGDCARLRPG